MNYDILYKLLKVRVRTLYKNPSFYEGLIVGVYVSGKINLKQYEKLLEYLIKKVEYYKEKKDLKDLEE